MIDCQLTHDLDLSRLMVGKRKAEHAITNIDPRTFKNRSLDAVSQHTPSGRTRVARVTAILNPVLPRLPEPPIFTADPSNFTEECGVDDGDDEDVSSYFSTQVYFFIVFLNTQLIPTLGQPAFLSGGRMFYVPRRIHPT